MRREAATIEAMIGKYCRDLHQSGRGGSLCPDCAGLLDYARQRLERCPYQEGKTTCGKCPIHCYRREMRGKVRKVMRYAGPRMLLKHPLLALMHSIDGLRRKPVKRERGVSGK